jgi:hypothetical protein
MLMLGRLWWFITGGQADFSPLFANKYVNVLMAQYGGVNVAPGIELFILVCILSAAALVAFSIIRLKQRRWVRACISLIASAAMTTAAYAASTTLSNLSAGAAVSGTDLFYDVQTVGSGGVKVTAAQLLTYIQNNIAQVTSITGGCGNNASAGAITPSNPAGAIVSQLTANVQTGSNYGIQVTDCGGIVVLSNGSNQIPTIPQAGSTGFTSGWYTTVCNVGAGKQTITPASGTIAGSASFVLAAGSETGPVCVGIYSGSAVGTNDYGVITGAGASVASVTGTSGQITCTPTTGAVICSLPSSITAGLTFTSPTTFTSNVNFADVIGTESTQSGTTYTFANTDCGTDVRFTSSSAITATIPSTLTVGCHINVVQRGSAKVSVNGTAVTACTLTSAHSYTGTSGTAGSVVGIIIDASTTCVLTGDGS